MARRSRRGSIPTYGVDRRWRVNLCWASQEAGLSNHDERDGMRQTIAVLILLAMLVGAGLFLTGALRGAARVQDCVAAGRTNCGPLRL